MTDNQPARQTHILRRHLDPRHGAVITKTYRSWSRGEHRREWSALRRLADHAPGLAPIPLSADLEAEPPAITMTVVGGAPTPHRWRDDQLDALAAAMERLWSTPADGLPPLDFHDPGYWRELAITAPQPPAGRAADVYDRVVAWINGDDLPDLLESGGPTVLGQGDPQPGNLLLDGDTVRLVDFEDAGPSDAAFELANFAEHLGTRHSGLERLADRFDVDPVRLRLCRRLLAAFWFLRLSRVRKERPADFAEQTLRLDRLLG